MIDVAVIAAVPHLHDVATLGTIDMALTHLVLAHPAYAAHYRARSDTGIPVHLDNSAFELNRGLGPDAVLNAAERINASVVICTDVPFDAAATVAATRRFLTHATRRGLTGHRFMAVPQGRTRHEWLTCYDQLAALPGVTMIGLSKLSVPRCFDAPVAEARIACVAELTRIGAPHPLHLLGGDRSLPWELAEHTANGHTRVISNDSSFAFWYAACTIPLDTVTGRAHAEAPTPPELLTTRLTAQQFHTARRNVEALRRAAALPD